MDYSKIEAELVEETVTEAAKAMARELADLQLTLNGGGIGDAIAF